MDLTDAALRERAIRDIGAALLAAATLDEQARWLVKRDIALRDAARAEQGCEKPEHRSQPSVCYECARQEVLKARAAQREAIIDWLAHRCQYGPPCGRCAYCRVATFIRSQR